MSRHRRRRTRSSEPRDLGELELDRGLATEDVDEHLDLRSWSSLISMISPEKSANGPSFTRTVSPMSYSNIGFDFLVASWVRSASTPRKFSTSLRRIGDGLPPWFTNPVTPGVLRMTYQASSSSCAAHEQVAREELLLGDDLLAVLELGDLTGGDDHLVDAALHVHRRDAGLEVLLDLLLVARLGVEHEPLGPGGRRGSPASAARRPLQQRVLVEQGVLVEHAGARRHRSTSSAGHPAGGRGSSVAESSAAERPRIVGVAQSAVSSSAAAVSAESSSPADGGPLLVVGWVIAAVGRRTPASVAGRRRGRGSDLGSSAWLGIRGEPPGWRPRPMSVSALGGRCSCRSSSDQLSNSSRTKVENSQSRP